MKTHFKLGLERSNYRSDNLHELELLLKEWLKGEGEELFNKSAVISAEKLTEEQKEEMYINYDLKNGHTFDGEKLKNVHYYNYFYFILETFKN